MQRKKQVSMDLMEIMLESMMMAERSEFLHENPQNKGNVYHFGHAYGQGRNLEFRIPRDRYGNFHSRILAILRNQEDECDCLVGVLTLMDSIAMEHKAFDRLLPKITCDKTLFPD